MLPYSRERTARPEPVIAFCVDVMICANIQKCAKGRRVWWIIESKLPQIAFPMLYVL